MKQSIYQIKKRGELKKRAATLYKQGLSLRQVAAILDRSHQWVSLAVSDKIKIIIPMTHGREYVRERVRARDNHTCQKCGKIWKDGERRFDIHHLNGFCGKKSRGYDSIKDIDGLITLCHKCHLSLDSVRKKMTKDSRRQVDSYSKNMLSPFDNIRQGAKMVK